MRNEPNPTRLDPKRERELVGRALTDRAALGELYDFHLPRLYGYILRRVGERSVAETITSRTFEQAVAALASDDFKKVSFGGWLYRSATAALRDHALTGRQLVSVKAAGKQRAGTGTTTKKTSGATSQETVAPKSNGRTARVTGDDAALDAFAKALGGDELAPALRRVPEAHRQVLMLRFYDGLEVDEICGLLGCSRAAFSGKLNRALGALRGSLLKQSTDAA